MGARPGREMDFQSYLHATAVLGVKGWYWIDGSAWDYTNWSIKPKQPSGDGSSMEMFGRKGDHKWNDLSGYRHSRSYVCQIDQL